MADQTQPTLIDCPNCRKALVLLSIENYPRLAHLSSGELKELPGDILAEVRDGVREGIDAKFAVIDRDGRYKCDWCGKTQTL
jgi:hypothetical protein